MRALALVVLPVLLASCPLLPGPLCQSVPETCNGLDDDCDGVVDQPTVTEYEVPLEVIDVLAVVDDDPSMAGEHDQVLASLGAAAESLSVWRWQPEVHFAVTGMSAGGALADEPAVLDPVAFDPEAFRAQILASAEGLLRQTPGTRTGLEAARLVLEARPGVGSDTRRLVLLFFTDGDDASGRSMEEYMGYFGRRGLARMVVVGGLQNRQPAACTDEACAQSCPETDPGAPTCECTATPSTRYGSFAMQVPGAAILSICDAAALPDQVAAALEPVHDHGEVPLHLPPPQDDPSAITLRIHKRNGTEVVCASPAAGQTCADGADFEYRSSPGPAIHLCDTSRCLIEAGDRYTVETAVCAS